MFNRKFTLRHTFDKVSNNFREEDSPTEFHFGIPWSISLAKLEERMSFGLNCERCEEKESPWSILANVTFRMEIGNEEEKLETSLDCEFTNEYNWDGIYGFCRWNTVMEKYVKNSELTVEIEVIIEEMKGIIPERKRSFDEPEKNMTDVVLMVGDRKFHVSKVILAEFSDFFKPLFFNGFKETNQSEIKLEEVDPDTFQMVLEVIYGRLECIQVETVEDILHLARQYQMKVVTSRCEEFMIHNEEVNEHLKFRLASEYNLHKLQEQLVKDVESIEDANEIFMDTFKYMDKEFCMKVLQNVYN